LCITRSREGAKREKVAGVRRNLKSEQRNESFNAGFPDVKINKH